MIRILALLLLLPFAANAQDYPQPISDTVSDFADLLDPAQEAQIAQTLMASRDETKVHITLVTMAHISDFGGSGQSIETYAKNLFNAWGVGDATRNDGILILVAKDDREMRIALGRGYDPVYDGYAQRVIDRDMLPAFKTDNYVQGIEAGVQSAIDRIARPFASNQTPQPVEEPNDSWLFGLFGLGAAGVMAMAFRRKIGDFLTRFRACPNCGQRTQTRTSSVETAATKTIAGLGVQITYCSNCQREHRQTYPIPIRSNTGSGNSGFGGGKSSGGGASGKW
jgi:uncharacterized protein